MKLSRCLIGESLFPVDIETMSEKLYRDRFTMVDVKQMGAYKTVMTFETKNDMEEALASDYLLNHFEEVRKWSMEECSQTRRVCVECF